MKVYSSPLQLVGNTPTVRLDRFAKANDTSNLLAKLEFFNPAGSSKDRIAKHILERAEKDGKLHEGDLVIEPTSGNTGIGIALVCAQKGYKAMIVMPDTMSVERQKLIRAYGAEIVLTDGKKGMQGAIDKAEELHRIHENSLILGQFTNPLNPETHYLTTGKELWEDTDGKVDIFVATVGTGGTITGVAKYLKKQNPNVKIIAVEPTASPFLSTGKGGTTKIQGIGAGFLPDTLDVSLVDEVVTVSDKDAFATAKMLAKTEGLFVGISSGACAHAGVQIAKKYPEKCVAMLFPDGGSRYLSTPDFID